MNVRFATAASGNPVHFVLVFLLLAGLPVIVWLDIRNLTEKSCDGDQWPCRQEARRRADVAVRLYCGAERDSERAAWSTFSIQRILTISKRLQRL